MRAHARAVRAIEVADTRIEGIHPYQHSKPRASAKPRTLNPTPYTLHPKTAAPNSKPCIPTQNPKAVRVFEVDESVEAEEAIHISWDLCFDPVGYMLVFRQVAPFLLPPSANRHPTPSARLAPPGPPFLRTTRSIRQAIASRTDSACPAP